MTTRIPVDETERIAELSRLCIVDGQTHPALDALVRMAKTVLDVPIVVVSVVDADHCRFLSSSGVDVDHVSRAQSPCSRVVLHNEALFISDTAAESRVSKYDVGGPVGAYGGVVLRGPTGQPVGVFAVMSREARIFSVDDEQWLQDLATQAQAHIRGMGVEQRLFQSEARFEEARRLFSHDLKTPSRQVRCLLQLLKTDVKRDPAHIVDLATRSAASMQRMVEGFDEYARIAPQGRVTPVPLYDALDGVWRSLRPTEGATLVADIAHVVLPCRTGALRQVLGRVLDNALRHGGRSDVTVRVTATREGGNWRVCVTDDGQGFAAKDSEHAFRMCHTLHGDKDRGGAGVGLPIARRLVQDVGAEMGIGSDGVTGTTVWFTWPALPDVNAVRAYESIAS